MVRAFFSLNVAMVPRALPSGRRRNHDEACICLQSLIYLPTIPESLDVVETDAISELL